MACDLMPPRLSLYVSLSLLPLVVTPVSCFAVNCYRSLTQLLILVTYLTFNLSDAPDINHKLRDMVRKANYVLVTFPSVGPLVLTKLYQSYCLSLYSSSLWSLSCPALHSLEVAFNNILRKIWKLPRRSHTGIVHSVANLYSLLNVVPLRSNRLLLSAMKCSSMLVKQIFSDSSSFCFSFSGYNYMFGSRHIKHYHTLDKLCASVIRSLRCSGKCTQLSQDIEQMIVTISSS